MRILSFALICFLFTTKSIAQYKPQIRFKPGISRFLPSPGGKGYAFVNNTFAYGSVVIGGEFSKPSKNKKGALQIGFTFQDMNTSNSPNTKNLDPTNLDTTDPPGFYFLGAPAKTDIYIGYEKYINRSIEKKSKNYFGIAGGVGFTFTLNKFNYWDYIRHVRYNSHSGEVIEGYTTNYISPGIPFGLSLYGGARYNITNRKGNEVFIIELLYNHGFTPFYIQTMDYKLNGIPQRDKLKEKGLNFQLNLITPLYTFNKKK